MTDVLELKCTLVGGLGNQLSIFAFAEYAARESGADLVVDLRGIPSFGQQRGSSLEELQLNFTQSIRANYLCSAIYKQLVFSYFRNTKSKLLQVIFGKPLTEQGLEVFLTEGTGKYRTVGYFTDPRHHHYSYAGARLKLSSEPSMLLKKLIRQVAGNETLVIHVRLGDSLSLANSRGVLGPNYFSKAVEVAMSKQRIDRVIIFSDDVQLAREKFADWDEFSGSITYVGNEISAAEVLVTMSRAANIIVSNSSLSWWSAYTSSSSNIVAPSEWTKEDPCLFLLSKDWTLVDPDWQ